jgi:hypothetical protein
MKGASILVAVTFAILLVLMLSWSLQGSSNVVQASDTARSTSLVLPRWHAPVVISGTLFPDLVDVPLDEIYVYASYDGHLQQIPFQIDERDAGGRYVKFENSRWDENDELVFMGRDGGQRMTDPALVLGSLRISPMYIVTVTDPISNIQAWAYVYRSLELSRTFGHDYVSYDVERDRILSPGVYAMGFSATHEFMNYLSLRDSDVNLLDRSKLRITATVGVFPIQFTVSVDETDVTKDSLHVIDGPVRVTRISTSSVASLDESAQGVTTLFAYRSLVVQPTRIEIPENQLEIDYLRFSLDWNKETIGWSYYDANNPAGVTIDGASDSITIQPPARWNQVSGITGTVVNVTEIPLDLGGTRSTYYQDDATIDSDDTGDQQSYGDAGLQMVSPPAGTFDLLRHTYFLTESTFNVGETFVAYYDSPLKVQVGAVTTGWSVYLPLVLWNGPSQ